ncbi:BSP-domain-containing protein, partial [Periconia macrospinosa]
TSLATSSTAPSAPQQSAPPPSTNDTGVHPDTESNHPIPDELEVLPPRKPLLRLELRDLDSKGSRSFLRLVHATNALEHAVSTVLHHLYLSLPTHCIPPTRSVTLVLEAMDGVAYTTGSSLDSDHKSIHLSTDYIMHVSETRRKEEIMGVLVHEMVHCWQHDAEGTAPGGLIEGIADWVRLKAGFAPPHWKKSAGDDDKWDSGYERTGFFLEWLEDRFGVDIVRKVNAGLRECKYEDGKVWKDCCGTDVEALWGDYKKSLNNGDEGKESKEE